MPIKWNITGKAMAARGIMDQISTEYDGFIADGSEHLGDLKALRGQVDEMKVDLYGAANIMGNSGGGSNEQPKPVVTQTVPPVVHLPPPAQNAPAPTASPPIAHTFRAEAEQQIAAGHK